MSCRDTIHLICWYLEGRLSPPVANEIKRHFESCSDCHMVLDAAMSTLDRYFTPVEELRRRACSPSCLIHSFKSLYNNNLRSTAFRLRAPFIIESSSVSRVCSYSHLTAKFTAPQTTT